ncbi:NAD-dependent epimerase/dehydratase family protein [Enterococcus casseliflavus]|uniref:NAD-dependent epimerase/dehydratase family protein n=1 Tax=Enterococcus casseliflavus TaxID=37734 RepID=UPI00188487BB|nr:NAD-dependent epimerase/dehydratase family protein [Enterococcus casseliflavus]MBE9900339.1 NAD-dependent epimerase/dehydratase family protein [Enterococcus casseliflavus]MBE9903624.1 NAD-dependent epimerase/dehydratase family protein [Enterococcus casseliflavus]MBE9923992.1 NAD-dependent epimerase/dehydratase family protein [Enterococcus casseliflavus]
MIRVLITGKNSYVGNSFCEFVKKNNLNFHIDTLSLKNMNWKKISFEYYDVIIHLAAIVHVKEKNNELYNKVNRDLAYDIAAKAKNDGVKHFIFFSTMSIYGKDDGCISNITKPSPKTPYGKSKLEAENLIKPLHSESFKVAIIRPPMIYGLNAKGNFKSLVKLANLLPIFPDYYNKRSMIFIDNLNLYLIEIIKNKSSGVFLLQNKNYVSTSELYVHCRRALHKRTLITRLFNFVIKILLNRESHIKKMFGNLIYDDTTFREDLKINEVTFVESIYLSISKESKI